MPNTLILRLGGYLQAWGERGRFTLRDTALTPTKSGVAGLLCAALGQPERVVTVQNALRMGVRVDQPGTVVDDYHTVSGGVRRANGLSRADTLVTHRFYLCDAVFGVALRGDDTLIAECAAALGHPVFPLYLGRLCCLPSAPILVGVGDYASLAEALGEGVTELECDPTPGGTFRMDRIRSRDARSFQPRFVERIETNAPVQG